MVPRLAVPTLSGNLPEMLPYASALLRRLKGMCFNKGSGIQWILELEIHFFIGCLLERLVDSGGN